MKLVAKYTLVLVAALGLAIAALAREHLGRVRHRFEEDMRTDHRVVGRVLQSLVTELWSDEHGRERAIAQTRHLIELADAGQGSTRFGWDLAAPPAEAQVIAGNELVSSFPVRAADGLAGAVVVRESLDEVDRLMHAETVYFVESFAVIVGVCVVASLALGGLLVGQPIRHLVAKARRVARRDFAGAVEIRRRDELGELAAEMNAMSDALSRALAQIAIETNARISAVEQLRRAERLATVGTLAAGLAHELGTPLSIVSGHAQMISGREVVGDPVIESAVAIDREADRMGRIVRQLLDFARRKGSDGATCDAAGGVQRCLTLLRPVIDHRQVTCSLELPAGPVRAHIDEDGLQHVITNLVMNAVQAMPGGGTLRVALAREPEAHVRISVADSGPGIAPDVLPHIFEPFFTTKQPGEGTGLGLAVAYGIVDDHQGRILVDTGAHGTTFSVVLKEAT